MELLIYLKHFPGGCCYQMWTGPFVLHYKTSHDGIFWCTEDSPMSKSFLDFQAILQQTFTKYFWFIIASKFSPFIVDLFFLPDSYKHACNTVICHHGNNCLVTIADVIEWNK